MAGEGPGAKITAVGESNELAGTRERPAKNNEPESQPRRRGRRVLAQVMDYAGLIGALRQRCDELNLTFDVLDEIAGFTDRYAAKLLAPTARPVRRLGHMSMGALLGALGVRIVLVEDREALAKVRARYRPRKYARPRGWRARVPVKRQWETPRIEDPANPEA
jgi:hypothetical protein